MRQISPIRFYRVTTPMSRSDYSIATTAGGAETVSSFLFFVAWMLVAVSCASGDTNIVNSANATNHAGNAPRRFSNTRARRSANGCGPGCALLSKSGPACIEGRRRICGKVLQIVPEGLVVESGYVGLLRPEPHPFLGGAGHRVRDPPAKSRRRKNTRLGLCRVWSW